MMMGVACRIAAAGGPADPAQLRKTTVVTAVACAAAIAVVTPPLWTTWQPHWLAWWLESYINGVHTFGTPQPWLFPLFPWAAFAFAGLAVGSLLLSDWARRNEAAALGVAGARRRCAGRVGTLARCAPLATLCRLRFLAHKSELFSGSHRRGSCPGIRELCVVPLGSGRVGLQPADRDGQVLFARVLGTHRVRLWRTFDFTQTERRDRNGDIRPDDNFRFDDFVGGGPQPVPGPEGRNPGIF